MYAEALFLPGANRDGSPASSHLAPNLERSASPAGLISIPGRTRTAPSPASSLKALTPPLSARSKRYREVVEVFDSDDGEEDALRALDSDISSGSQSPYIPLSDVEEVSDGNEGDTEEYDYRVTGHTKGLLIRQTHRPSTRTIPKKETTSAIPTPPPTPRRKGDRKRPSADRPGPSKRAKASHRNERGEAREYRQTAGEYKSGGWSGWENLEMLQYKCPEITGKSWAELAARLGRKEKACSDHWPKLRKQIGDMVSQS